MTTPRVLSALVAALVAACAVGPDDVWHGSRDFAPDERAAIEAGASFAAEMTAHERPIILWDGAEDAERRIVRAPVPAELCATCSGFHVRDGARETIILSAELTHAAWGVRPDDGAGLAGHEFGHFYGMKHLAPGVIGLMNATASGTLHWSDADTAECELHCRY